MILIKIKERFGDFRNFIVDLSFSKMLMINVGILVLLNLFLFIFQIPAGFDFYYFYSMEAVRILSGQVPFVHFIPVYPLGAEAYFV
ncbi:MAG: hypothetical protein ACXQS8_03815, partial [Candidatus Helarchaeales archaeon]